MPPLRFAQVNGIRMGYYEAGPTSDAPPMVLCHGWPEMAFSWRHQIKALSEAGIRVIAPDQRGYGATERPETFVKPSYWSDAPPPKPHAAKPEPDPDGLSPTRYGDWELKGIAVDF